MRSCKLARLRRAAILFFILPPAAIGAGRRALAQSQDQQAQMQVPAQPCPQTQLPTRGGGADVCADKLVGREGDVATYEGHVDIRYQDLRLQADHVDYNEKTNVVHARGNVIFDHENEHLEADDAVYDRNTGQGVFHHVHGTVKSQPRPNVVVLVTTNPLTFDAEEVDRIGEHTYKLHSATVTVCDPSKPTWKFYAPTGTVHVEQKVALVNANFRLYRIPLFWLPYATAPAGKNMRESGFEIPTLGQSNQKGTILGDGYYWAPTQWFDATVGGEFMSARGWSSTDEVRATPWDNVNLYATFYGVSDKEQQGGNETKVKFDALLPHGWRAVVDVDNLSSLTFRLAFSPTFGEAVNAEANTSVFLSNNFNGFSLNFGFLDNRDFLTAGQYTTIPESTVTIRALPTVNFSSVDQNFWQKLPFYWGFDADVGGMYRSDEDITTPAIVQRTEFAPRVTLPLHWHSWLGLTTTFAFRTTRYSAQLEDGAVVVDPLVRNTGELTSELQLPSFGRIWQHGASKWKHSIEPELIYRYVTGVNDFSRFIRFDDDETLTDTNELEYGVTNRIYRKTKDGTPQELFTWKLVQKYYFDPTFGGAIVTGQPNVFEALDSISAFAIADGPIRFSPLVSDFLITPGGPYDGEVRLEYDTTLHRFVSAGELLKIHPWEKLTLTLADFDINPDPFLQPRSDQVRALLGYGDQSKKGWNFTGGFSYDLEQRFIQNEVVQLGYNGSCCGIQVEYRRISLPTIRDESQVRASLVIANIGSFGNVKRQDKIF
jgi:LPS-assembly protein